MFVAGWRHALRSEWPFIITNNSSNNNAELNTVEFIYITTASHKSNVKLLYNVKILNLIIMYRVLPSPGLMTVGGMGSNSLTPLDDDDDDI